MPNRLRSTEPGWTDAPVAGHATPQTSPVRVLHLTSVETSNYYLNSLVEELHPDRAVIMAATTAGRAGFVQALQMHGVDVHALGPAHRLTLPLLAVRFAVLAIRLRAQVIHGHLFEPAIMSAIAARLTGLPLVVTRHHSDAVHRIENGLRRAFYLRGESVVNRTAHCIIAPARMVADVLVEREGVSPARVRLIPYPQPKRRFSDIRPSLEMRRELRVGNARVLVAVCRLHPEKGLPTLLRAFATLPRDLQLYVVGAGPERGALERLAAQLGVAGRAQFLGWREDALSILAAADVVVHPSLHEALPSAVIEALALGKPVVASDVSGVRDILGDQEYGWIVPSGDATSLACAIAAALANPAVARARAELGRTFLFEYMRPDRVADAHLTCYLSAL